MTEEEIKTLVESGMPGASVSIGGDGYHIDVIVVSDDFEGLSRVRRQQLVYGLLSDAIRSGAVHAVNVKAMTLAERSLAASSAR
jgi:acid stress-induced BolA-like protein IbaG/YrbA